MGKAGASSGGLRDPPPHPTFPGSATRPPAALGPAVCLAPVDGAGGGQSPTLGTGCPPTVSRSPRMWVHRQAGMLGGPGRPHLPAETLAHTRRSPPRAGVVRVQEGVVGELSAQQSPSEGWAASAANADGPKQSAGPTGGRPVLRPGNRQPAGLSDLTQPGLPVLTPSGAGSAPEGPARSGSALQGRQAYIPERQGPSAPSRFLPLLGFSHQGS